MMQKLTLDGIGGAIIDFLSFTAGDDQTGVTQRAQMMRNSGCGHTHHGRQIDDAVLVMTEQPKQAHAGRVTELLEYICDELEMF